MAVSTCLKYAGHRFEFAPFTPLGASQILTQWLGNETPETSTKMVFQMRMIILIVAAALVSTSPCHAYLSMGPSEAPLPAIEQPNKDQSAPDAPKPAIEQPGTGLAPSDAQRPAMGQPNSGSAARPRQDYTKRRSTPTSSKNNSIGTGGRIPVQGIAD
jgi:hypothetical protein